jgi:hypothetical protein
MALLFVEPAPNVFDTFQQSLLDFMGPHAPETQVYHLLVGTPDWRNWPLAPSSPAWCLPVAASCQPFPMGRTPLAR